MKHGWARGMATLFCVAACGAGAVYAEQAAPAQPMDLAKRAAMEKMQQLGSPSEGHKALEPLVGRWTYTAQWWMSPEEAPSSMTGTSENQLIYGGRFLQQQIRGEAHDQPFEGTGVLGYDNIRKAYQSVWFDNMSTGLMTASGQYDAATTTLTEQGDFSCPMTGETHRQFRATWKVVDPDHTVYESYSLAPDGREFKAMEIRYTREQ